MADHQCAVCEDLVPIIAMQPCNYCGQLTCEDCLEPFKGKATCKSCIKDRTRIHEDWDDDDSSDDSLMALMDSGSSHYPGGFDDDD